HWHSLMAIWAMRAGKDVYVEKPVSHNVREGRLMVEASRKYNRICQTGTQSRSTTGMRQAIGYVRSGKIGDVNLAYGTCYKPRKSIGKVDGPQPTPKSMDYDLWCGPARMLPPTRKSVHYDWHWVWEYGNGDLGNQGIHEMDKARWGLGVESLPERVLALGGRFGYIDDGETANTQLCLYDYGTKKILFEVRGLPTKDYRGAMVGNIFVGTEGYVVCPNYSSGTVFDKDGKKVTDFKGGGEDLHFANFVKAVRSRKREDQNADILEGHLSSAMCHLGNISYRLGTPGGLSAEVPGLSDLPAGADSLKRLMTHLTDNKLEPEKLAGRIGTLLTIDPKTETFTTKNDAATAMLFREYRKGFDPTEAV
ncbi:MAG: Gfo/Idh/MocA family protein, partial [Gemmataceae bacterium]